MAGEELTYTRDSTPISSNSGLTALVLPRQLRSSHWSMGLTDPELLLLRAHLCEAVRHRRVGRDAWLPFVVCAVEAAVRTRPVSVTGHGGTTWPRPILGSCLSRIAYSRASAPGVGAGASGPSYAEPASASHGAPFRQAMHSRRHRPALGPFRT